MNPISNNRATNSTMPCLNFYLRKLITFNLLPETLEIRPNYHWRISKEFRVGFGFSQGKKIGPGMKSIKVLVQRFRGLTGLIGGSIRV